MHLQLGQVSTEVVSSPEIAKEIMKTHDIIFAYRPLLVVLTITTYGYTDIAFALYGNYWRQLQKLCMTKLLSVTRVQSFQSIREEEATFSGGSERSSTVVEWAMSEMTMASSADSEGPWFLPDILVNVQKFEDENLGVIQEVLSDGSCKVALGSNHSGNTVITLPSEMEIIPPRKSDKIKIMGCSLRGFTGKLISVDAMDGI
ncbi:hypothetical protein PTKIN_Ptkin18bG0028600 [Pterospermum kingtungense]